MVGHPVRPSTGCRDHANRSRGCARKSIARQSPELLGMWGFRRQSRSKPRAGNSGGEWSGGRNQSKRFVNSRGWIVLLDGCRGGGQSPRVASLAWACRELRRAGGNVEPLGPWQHNPEYVAVDDGGAVWSNRGSVSDGQIDRGGEPARSGRDVHGHSSARARMIPITIIDAREVKPSPGDTACSAASAGDDRSGRRPEQGSLVRQALHVERRRRVDAISAELTGLQRKR